jgi:Fe-S-cluster-containing dehydrogenase component
MTKCHFCHHRDAGPACAAACPTGALQIGAPEHASASRALVPGFTDPAGCQPATRFLPPRGARREALLRALEERLARR